jgi:hypothetical protein
MVSGKVGVEQGPNDGREGLRIREGLGELRGQRPDGARLHELADPGSRTSDAVIGADRPQALVVLQMVERIARFGRTGRAELDQQASQIRLGIHEGHR